MANVENRNSDALIAEMIKQLEEIKAEDITLLDLRDIENTVCSYFLICSGTSNTHVSAISSFMEKEVSKSLREKPWHVEGAEQSEWVLMDYVDVVVHVFQKPIREFYDIEGLWGDAKITRLSSEN